MANSPFSLIKEVFLEFSNDLSLFSVVLSFSLSSLSINESRVKLFGKREISLSSMGKSLLNKSRSKNAIYLSMGHLKLSCGAKVAKASLTQTLQRVCPQMGIILGIRS